MTTLVGVTRKQTFERDFCDDKRRLRSIGEAAGGYVIVPSPGVLAGIGVD
jgi:hypothetical protein